MSEEYGMANGRGGMEFEFDLAGPLFEQIRECIDQVVSVPLSDQNISMISNRPGVYLLLHDREPVYVGKADDSVPTRLARHRRTISGCRNISLGEVEFKCVCFAKTWDPFKPEDNLIHHYGTNRDTGWNGKGFGANDPGVNRGDTRLAKNHFFKRFPIDGEWVCDWIISGDYPALELLRSIKDRVPFWFRFQGNRMSGNRNKVLEARRDYEATIVSVPRTGMTARELLYLIASRLPAGWQATITPSHMLLYKERDAMYPDMEVIWPS